MTAFSEREPAAVILSEAKDLSQQSAFSHWWSAAGPYFTGVFERRPKGLTPEC
jgi:hypothetical protein